MVFASGFPADGAERSDSGVTLAARTEILEPRLFSSAIFIDSRLRPRSSAHGLGSQTQPPFWGAGRATSGLSAPPKSCAASGSPSGRALAGPATSLALAAARLAPRRCDCRINDHCRQQRCGCRAGTTRLIDFYDMKIAAGIGFRVLVSVRRRNPDLDGKGVSAQGRVSCIISPQL